MNKLSRERVNEAPLVEPEQAAETFDAMRSVVEAAERWKLVVDASLERSRKAGFAAWEPIDPDNRALFEAITKARSGK